MKKLLYLLLAATMVFSMTACGAKPNTSSATDTTEEAQPEPPSNAITVYAPNEMEASLQTIVENYKAIDPESTIDIQVGSDKELADKINNGEGCDVFISASNDTVKALTEGGKLAADSVAPFLENKVVLVEPSAEEKKTSVSGFENVTSCSNVAMPDETTPLGKTAMEVFDNIGNGGIVKTMITPCATPDEVVTAVTTNSNTVGVLLGSDYGKAKSQVSLVAEAAENVCPNPIVYSVALGVSPKTNSDLFASYIQTSEGTDVLKENGFSDYKVRKEA